MSFGIQGLHGRQSPRQRRLIPRPHLPTAAAGVAAGRRRVSVRAVGRWRGGTRSPSAMLES
jgi:hypothetical protein